MSKFIAAVVTAAALSLPLAGVASADPDPDTNPGLPGNIGAVGTPGNIVSTYLAPGDGPATDLVGAPGQFINPAAPGQQNLAGN